MTLYACPECPRTFMLAPAHIRHVRSHYDIEQRFVEKIYFTSGCWLWLGALDTNGYGTFSIHHKQHQAHRVAYEQMVGRIPEGLSIDHLCHNRDLTCNAGNACQHRRCVRPDHLEAVPLVVNWKRGRGPSLLPVQGRAALQAKRALASVSKASSTEE